MQRTANDSFVRDYIDMIRTLRALPSKPRVFAMTLVPLYEPYPYDMNPYVCNELISAVPGGAVDQAARATGADVIDIHQVFVAGGYDASITCDGCHPRDAGYTLIAAAMAPLMRKAAHERVGLS